MTINQCQCPDLFEEESKKVCFVPVKSTDNSQHGGYDIVCSIETLTFVSLDPFRNGYEQWRF